ncbi:hypothetical protein F4808DRAFT_430895 [Astrocystis sublimbata]|nr:hypothetical protein F4808DRAFT_430895 [Astrocystis sublimbata]
MDFASLMSSEIAKSKPTTDPSSSNTNTTTTTKKYIRNSEASAAREASYLAEQAALETKRQARLAEKRRHEDEAAEEALAREERRRKLAEDTRRRREEAAAEEERRRRKRLGLPEKKETQPQEEEEKDDDDDDDDEEEDIPPPILLSKLREIAEPATLFGETHRARLKRYRRLTTSSRMTTGPIPTTLKLVDEADMKVSTENVPQDAQGRRYLFRQLASYFTMVLREWEGALAREQQKAQSQTESGSAATAAVTSFESKAAINAMVSSRSNMVPLFRRFESGDLDDDILKPIVEIVQAAQERRYVDANDGYLRLSIGKAAWPIGVTMVGIHERSAREKLHNGERGHVMGDEVTRKYLQSIKRCLTFAQVRWPPEDIRQLMG